MIRSILPICLILHALFIMAPGTARGQDPDPGTIIDSVRQKIERIMDYQADIEIEVDVEFIRMPVKHATIYYKQPDRVRFESDEFLMLPKRGFDKQVTDILDEPYSAIYLGREMLEGKENHLLRIVPLGKKPEVVLATWWIDTENYLITRNESTLRKGGNFTVDFIYGDPGIPLPTQMTFSIEVEKFSIPLKFIGKAEGMEIDRDKMKEDSRGKVYIRFSNYRINQGLDDASFTESSGE